MDSINFVKKEIERYSKQILVVGKQKQEKLKKYRVTVIGCGGISASLLMSLAASGVGTINIIEFDSIENSNLGRQILFREDDIGLPKGIVAKNFLQSLNPYVKINYEEKKVGYRTLSNYLPITDMFIETSDNIQMKYEMNRFAIIHEIPTIIGAISIEQSHVFGMYKSVKDTKEPCYECIFEKPETNESIPDCSNHGILSVTPGLIGNIMSYLCIHYILNSKFSNSLYVLQDLCIRNIPLQSNTKCKFCQKYI